MGKLDELKNIIDAAFKSATEPDAVKALSAQLNLVNEAMAEEQDLLNKHDKLKKDYVSAIKSTVVPGMVNGPQHSREMSTREIIAKAGLTDAIKNYQD